MMTAEPDDPLAELARLDGVPSAMGAARDAVDALLRDRGRRSVSAEQSVAALLAAAEASAALEQQLSEDDHEHGGYDWGSATVRLYSDLVDQAELIRISPGQAIARAHAVLGRGMLADDDLGRLRPGEEIGARVNGLDRLLAGPTTAPVIVVAAIAHAELITAAPFVAGNGILARAVQHMILIEGGIDRPPVTVPEVAERESGQAYRQALAGYRSGRAAGVRDWLLHVAATVARGAELSPVKPIRRTGSN